MKITSLAILVLGSLLAFYGLNAMDGIGHDLLRVLSSVDGAMGVLPLPIGMVMVAVSIAGLLPESSGSVRRQREAARANVPDSINDARN